MVLGTSSNSMSVAVYAPAIEAEQIKNKLIAAGEKNGKQFTVTLILQDLASEDDFNAVINSNVQLVVISQNVAGFGSKIVNDFVHARGSRPRAVAVWVKMVGASFDVIDETGAATYRHPLEEKDVQNLVENLDILLAEAAQRIATGALIPEAPPEVESIELPTPQLGAQGKQALQAISIWSTKGGDGKSIIVSELAYVLAMFGGRQTLLVDADMNRGYYGSTLSDEGHAKGNQYNITSLSTVFKKNKKIDLENYVWNYPSPFLGEGRKSQLDLIFGILNIGQADSSGLIGDDATRFINALIQAAMSAGYEFIIFDIGTLILHALHQTIIRSCSTLLIVSSPNRGSILPTEDGIQVLIKKELTSRTKMRLVLNKWTKRSNMGFNEAATYLDMPQLAALPAMDIGLMDQIINSQMLVTEIFLEEPKKYEELAPLVMQILALAEAFSSGITQKAIEISPAIAEASGQKRKGIKKGRKRRK